MFQGNYNPNPGGFLGIKRINWSSLLNNTQKTLNIINQAIPIVYQVKPIISNAKTMFKVISAVKEDDPIKPNNQTYNNNTKDTEKNTDSHRKQTNENRPIFYI